jgi:hypothetical protein
MGIDESTDARAALAADITACCVLVVLITVYIPRWYTCDCGAYVIGSDVLLGSTWLTWLTTPTTIPTASTATMAMATAITRDERRV